MWDLLQESIAQAAIFSNRLYSVVGGYGVVLGAVLVGLFMRHFSQLLVAGSDSSKKKGKSGKEK